MKKFIHAGFCALLLALSLVSQSVSAQSPVRFDTDYLYELLVSNSQNEFLPVSEHDLLWRLEQLSGSWRFICPASDVALRVADGGKLETGEVNGSDEAQLWRIERTNVDGVYLVRPANVADTTPYRFRIVKTKDKVQGADGGKNAAGKRR